MTSPYLTRETRSEEEARAQLPRLRRQTRTFDAKCFDLAEFFLADERLPVGPARNDATCALAMVIQESIEDFINHDLKNYRGKE